MLEQVVTYLQEQLATNEFLVGGAGTVLLSSALYLARSLPLRLWRFLVRRNTVDVSVNSDNRHFVKIAKHLNKRSIQWASRSKALDEDKLTIGYATSLAKWGSYFCLVKRVKEESDSHIFKQTIQITFIFASVDAVNKLMAELLDELTEATGHTSVYSVDSYGGLDFLKRISNRTRDNVYVPADDLDQIEERIDFFNENKDWYNRTGIPYKLGFMFHGKPGTGKTTLAQYAAAYSGRSIITATPTGIKEVASTLQNRERYERTEQFILIIEDIDCFHISNKRDDQKDDSQNKTTANLADLLNTLDGLYTPNDIIIVATTNDLDSLDPALVRKGRFDCTIEVGTLSQESALKMIKCFFPDSDIAGWGVRSDLTGAELQDIILSNLDNYSELMNNLLDDYDV